jgi:type II secretory pathway predicted ATPase ExeA
MYESFYHLKEAPFAQRPDPRFVFLAPPHRTTLMMLEDMLAGETALCLVTGQPGSGKTMLINYLLTRIRRPTNVGMVSGTQTGASLLQRVCTSFELEAKSRRDSRLAKQFRLFVQGERARGHCVLLIVDDAEQVNSRELLTLSELLRDINRKETQLQIILVGQRQLRSVIRSPELLQLAKQVGADCDIGELSPVDARRYIYHRLRIAGGQLSTFTETAILRIHEVSDGIPRLINQFCEWGLQQGAAAGAETINSRMMMDIIQKRQTQQACL